VDDEESNLLLLRRILELEGYTDIHVCSDAALVPEMFIRLAPDLVLLDLHMTIRVLHLGAVAAWFSGR